MFNLNDTMRYFLCPGRTDMCKGITSLCGYCVVFIEQNLLAYMGFLTHQQFTSNGDIRSPLRIFIFDGDMRRPIFDLLYLSCCEF